ncbi:corticotropin-releasing factor receptor 2-like [Branchiostoma floridae x Branchiostoma belcheri]
MAEDNSTGLWTLTTQVAHTLKEAAMESYTAVLANGTYVFLKELIITEEECLGTDFNIPEGDYCNSTWDRIYCWPPVAAGTTVYLPCPEHKGYDGSKVLAYRTCNQDGQWLRGPWTNYTACLQHKLPPEPPVKELPILTFVVRDIYFYGSCMSLAFLLATVFIYYYLRRLSSSGRITIHKNLAISFLLYYILSVVLFEPYINTPENIDDSYRQVPGLCEFLVGASRYFFTTNVFWMFVEGLHLHKRIAVAVFSAETNMLLYSAIGWGIPSLLVVAWSVVMVMFHAQACWDQYNQLPYAWILSGPIYLVLLVNLAFLINIIRILVQKLKEKQTVESQQVTKAAKATLILFPLLGVPHLLLIYDPADGGAGQWIYQIFNAFMQAMQGVFIAVIYCFFDLEVQREFRRIIGRWSRRRSSTLRRTSSSALTRQSHRPLAVDRSFDRSISYSGSFRMHSMRRGVDSGCPRSTTDDWYPGHSCCSAGQRVEAPNNLQPISADIC